MLLRLVTWDHPENRTDRQNQPRDPPCVVLEIESGFLSGTGWTFLLCYTGRFFSPCLPPPLQRQHKAMKDWRQSDVLWFILPESLRMLSVPHEGSDESRLSVRHLIISQKSLWCYPLTMAHSSLLTTVPTNNEELTAATNGDRVVPTVHLRVRQIKWKRRKLSVLYIIAWFILFFVGSGSEEEIFHLNTKTAKCDVRKTKWKTDPLKIHCIEQRKYRDNLTF